MSDYNFDINSYADGSRLTVREVESENAGDPTVREFIGGEEVIPTNNREALLRYAREHNWHIQEWNYGQTPFEQAQRIYYTLLISCIIIGLGVLWFIFR